MKQTIAGMGALGLVTFWTFSAAQADILSRMPKEGTCVAVYRVYWQGIYVANAFHTVKKLRHQRYVAQVHSIPRFSFIPFEYLEKSVFLALEKTLRPTHFHFRWREKTARRQGSVHFKPSKRTDAPATSHKQDRVSLLFQLSRDLENQTPPLLGQQWSYTVVEAKKQKKYQFERLQKECIKTPLGHFQTIKIQQSAPPSKRQSHLWFALDKNWMLVKIAQFKEGHLMGYSLLQSFQCNP